MVGDDYWDTTSDDPYQLPVRGVNNPDHCRNITQLLFLLGFNASDEQSLFKAFRSELDYTAYPYRFPDDVLSELLEGIKDRHPKISHLICCGAGLRLMNLDSHIYEYVIEEFVERDTPILTVHDSFIVPFGTERQLERVMKEAFEYVTKQRHVKAKYNQNLTETQLYAGRAVDRDWYLDMISMVSQPKMAKRYQLRMERHEISFSD